MNFYSKYRVEELLTLVCKSDEAAFSELYDRFWKKLYAIAYNRISEKQTAEDIVHDVFVSLWANRQAIKIEKLENYLAVSVKYAVLAYIRKKAKESSLPDSVLLSKEPESALADAILQHKQLVEFIKAETEKLPERCRLIFRYSREAQLPIKAIANKLNLSPKTVENQLTKALRHMHVATRNFLNIGILLFQVCQLFTIYNAQIFFSST